MENSAYVPNSGHLNSPALVVFSQAAGGLQDALRIQRPFNPQVIISFFVAFLFDIQQYIVHLSTAGGVFDGTDKINSVASPPNI